MDQRTEKPIAAVDSAASRGKMAQQIGGSLNLACRTDLSVPVSPGSTVQFFVPKDIGGAMIETLVGDVPDKNIAVVFGTGCGRGL
ncbi:MAG: hypothetical protein WKF77_13560 [Planctomycetaceae bacterium]